MQLVVEILGFLNLGCGDWLVLAISCTYIRCYRVYRTTLSCKNAVYQK